ncbi:MAG: OmpA family protein [Alphaproteobacteria bacterium]|nr:OmpA family protein [Alphaproteobacteria bacterium]
MLLSFRLSTSLIAYVLVLALVAVPMRESCAQPTPENSVETYVDQVLPSGPADGIMPEGMIWNRPLKAGDMVLPRLTKPKVKTKDAGADSRLAVGELKAPQLSSSYAQAPKLNSESKSTASMMLLQGMKSALQKAGQNPDLPKSDLMPVDPSLIEDAPTLITLPTVNNLAAAPVVPSAFSGETPSFVAGQEPKGWVVPVETNASTQMMDIVFPPEMSGGSSAGAAAAVSVPKATDIQEEPSSLEAASTDVTAPVEDADEPGFLDRIASPFTSIFGEPVKEGPAANTQKEKSEKTSAKSCESKVEKWTRACGEAGYPAHFVGQIVGETRKDCNSGESKDVWLSNSCAAPIASSPFAVQDKTAVGVDPSTVAISSSKAALSPNSVIVPELSVSTDGACGVANGLAADSKPSGDLCNKGLATSVSGNGPWRWSCSGLHGGMTVSCAAPVSSVIGVKKGEKESSASPNQNLRVEDAKCGESVHGGLETAPSTNLCEKGTPSLVNGNGPWTWACSGLNGGAAVACTANKKMDGSCGLADGVGADSMPMRDLCTTGYASAVTGSGPWNWSCSGLYGGAAAMCSASVKVNAVCGPASMKGFSASPQEDLCSVGSASDLSGNGPWSWTCKGDLGGASVSCQASVLSDGACGPAHGSRYAEIPKEGLCAQGLATRVTGLGPWNWNCSGSNGGSTASCTAALGTQEEVNSVVKCGKAAEALALSVPTDALCDSGRASSVSGDGPWTWSCEDEAGHSTRCTTVTASEGVCGKAANKPSKEAPLHSLCEKGMPGDVTMSEKTSWKWECLGSMGASSVTCIAPLTSNRISSRTLPAPTPEAQCGSASGSSLTERPESNLCQIGKASSVHGHGPWTWTCGNKTKVACEAQKTVEARCGATNGSVQKSIPTSGLCARGSATEVSGNGPWMWSCVGAGGGASSSCSAASFAQTRVDGVCGVAANAVMLEGPTANLCDSGSPSTVYGDGPWTWTCSGMNGGIASTCQTSKVVPKAPPPPGPAVNGLCGFSNGVAADSAPEDGLCTSGTVTALSGNGPWNWACIGANGGMTVSCTAPLVPPAPIVGSCGGANGVSTLTIPKSGLCSAGISSAVSGKGPWTWSCSGTNGGGAVSCVAPLAGSTASSQGLPSMVTPSLATEAPSPRAAPVGLVTPQLPSGPLPALKPGELPQLKSSKKVSLSVKASKNKEIASAPVSAPALPEGMGGVTPPPIRETQRAIPGLIPPVLDSDGNPIPTARLVLDPDISTISFERGSDQLDKDAVQIVEKITNIMRANGNARITLIAYSDTGAGNSPREARRLSLNRALAIRDFMTAKGVSSSRVDVRPMGANVPSGDMDRVDVKVN